MKTTKPERRSRAVTLLDLRPESDIYDPALDDNSRSPILGVSFQLLEKWGLARYPGEFSRLGREYRDAIAAGKLPPPRAVNLEDWWELGRLVLERRQEARLTADDPNIDPDDAQEQAGHEVAAMLAPIRDLLRWSSSR
jgi:hypothetical protein